MNAERFSLSRDDAALLVVDMQDRLARVMPDDLLRSVLHNTTVLIEGARVLGVPVLATEQYPQGLGHTVPEVSRVLEGAPFAKTEFSCAANPEVAAALDKLGRKQVLVCGMEAHVCVFQTVRDLAARGYVPFVIADAVVSRTEENRAAGLHLMEKLGATLTTTETALFDLLGRAGTPEFKKISALVKPVAR